MTLPTMCNDDLLDSSGPGWAGIDAPSQDRALPTGRRGMFRRRHDMAVAA